MKSKLSLNKTILHLLMGRAIFYLHEESETEQEPEQPEPEQPEPEPEQPEPEQPEEQIQEQHDLEPRLKKRPQLKESIIKKIKLLFNSKNGIKSRITK